MIPTLIVLLVIALISLRIWLDPALTHWRRKQLKRRPFPPHWQAVVEQAFPLYDRLSPDERKRLRGHIQVFLAEKQFIGCAGLEVSEEMRVTVATIACLLLLHERGRYFPNLRSILMYPTAYQVNVTTEVGKFVVEERQEVRLGESWSRDQLVLAWDRVQQDTQNWTDGHNVVLHEFAHQLDQEDGQIQGVPLLPHPSDYDPWQQVMTQTYHQLCRDLEQGSPTVIDGYGATSPAEFFAVTTETFFEQPYALLTQHSALYGQLRRYYQLDPLQWGRL